MVHTKAPPLTASPPQGPSLKAPPANPHSLATLPQEPSLKSPPTTSPVVFKALPPNAKKAPPQLPFAAKVAPALKSPPPPWLPPPPPASPLPYHMKPAQWAPKQHTPSPSKQPRSSLAAAQEAILKADNMVIRACGTGMIVGLSDFHVVFALVANRQDLLLCAFEDKLGDEPFSLLDLAVRFGREDIAVECVQRGVSFRKLKGDDLASRSSLQAAIAVGEINEEAAAYIRGLESRKTVGVSRSPLDEAIAKGEPLFAMALANLGVPLLDPDALLRTVDACMRAHGGLGGSEHQCPWHQHNDFGHSRWWSIIAALQADIGAHCIEAKTRFLGHEYLISLLDIAILCYNELNVLLCDHPHWEGPREAISFVRWLVQLGAASTLGPLLGTFLWEQQCKNIICSNLQINLKAIQVAAAVGVDLRSLRVDLFLLKMSFGYDATVQFPVRLATDAAIESVSLLGFAIANGQRHVVAYLSAHGCEQPHLTAESLHGFPQIMAASEALLCSRRRYKSLLLQLARQFRIVIDDAVVHLITTFALPIPLRAEAHGIQFHPRVIDRIIAYVGTERADQVHAELSGLTPPSPRSHHSF